MSIKFNVCLNQGNEALQTGKSITANEVCETADNKFVAHHVELHTRSLITEDIAKIVLDNFCETVAELVGQGYAVQLCKDGDVMLRIFPDIHLNGDSINLARAQQLDPTVTDLTLENAGDLAARVGVTVKPRAIVTAKFLDLLDAKKGTVERNAVVEKPYVARNGSTAGNDTGNGGNDSGNGGNQGDPNGGND